MDDRGGDDTANAGNYIPYEIVHSDTRRGPFGHKLSEHSRRHAENDHGSDTEEEVAYHLLPKSASMFDRRLAD